MDIPNELRDTVTDEELDMPVSKIIADQAKKTQVSKPKAGTGRQKRTAAQAALDEPRTKATTTPFKGGSAGRKAFTVAELQLLNECVEEVGFEGGDLWIKAAEKFNRERCVRVPPSEWPERSVNSLKKKFTEASLSFPLCCTCLIDSR